MPALSSSNLASAEFREADEAKGTPSVLTIQFKNGTVYEYDAVPRPTYEALLEAPSPGKFLNSEIKNRFGFRKTA